MLLMIDNYDSFTYNLVQYFYEMNQEVAVYRNDEITLADIESKSPDYLVISPGPCTPKEAGISVEAIKQFSGSIPILGVCLGHQSIGAAFGANELKLMKSCMENFPQLIIVKRVYFNQCNKILWQQDIIRW